MILTLNGKEYVDTLMTNDGRDVMRSLKNLKRELVIAGSLKSIMQIKLSVRGFRISDNIISFIWMTSHQTCDSLSSILSSSTSIVFSIRVNSLSLHRRRRPHMRHGGNVQTEILLQAVIQSLLRLLLLARQILHHSICGSGTQNPPKVFANSTRI